MIIKAIFFGLATPCVIQTAMIFSSSAEDKSIAPVQQQEEQAKQEDAMMKSLTDGRGEIKHLGPRFQ